MLYLRARKGEAASWTPVPGILLVRFPLSTLIFVFFWTPQKVVPSGPRVIQCESLVHFWVRFGTQTAPERHPRSHQILGSANKNRPTNEHDSQMLSEPAFFASKWSHGAPLDRKSAKNDSKKGDPLGPRAHTNANPSPPWAPRCPE